MATSQASTTTLGVEEPPEPTKHMDLDLSSLPPVFVLQTHLDTDHLHELEDKIVEHGAALTYDMSEARLVLGKVGTKRRAEFELRTKGVRTEEVKNEDVKQIAESPAKRRRTGLETKQAVVIDDESTESEAEDHDKVTKKRKLSVASVEKVGEVKGEGNQPAETSILLNTPNHINVVKLEWLEDSIKESKILPLKKYIVYQGRILERPPPESSSQSRPRVPPGARLVPNTTSTFRTQHRLAEKPQTGQSILARAKADAGILDGTSHYQPTGPRHFGHARVAGDHSASHKTHLLQQTTSEYEGQSSDIPDPPDWVKQNLKYACQRSTPPDPPNDDFIEQLKKIRLGRILVEDEIGVRAYSTSIASLAAYPYKILNPKEILQLPGCDVKIANLWIEWKNNNGNIKIVDELERDETIKVLRSFYDIWGVGATTAREFYEKGWRDLDDVVEYGWSSLSRVQQIGVKYYDEFLDGILRPEVEFIRDKVREHAVRVRDEGIEVLVVGGYRRGKERSGDVDMIVSHRDLDATANLVTDIISSLETEGWVTHTLLLSLHSTSRGQSTLPYKASGPSHGTGFDTLDKALVVWQDPNWPTRDADLAANLKAKNPNVHRRVDIIISPWRTVGCAVAGWSSGTTFQRDLRRYARAVKGWKFDSSGVRDRSNGEVVELEGPNGVDGSMVDAEKKVFEGFDLVYREPWERCTG